MSINEQPLVTVYIPTFNRLELLQRAVKSVQNQTYQNIEIIIVDDCSTDGTQEYLPSLVIEDERVRYFIKNKNSGACVSRNIAIEHATGEFITGLDDDDYFKPNRIELFVFNAKENNNILFSMYGNTGKNNKLKIFLKKLLLKNKVTKKDLIMNNYIGNQIFIKTKILKDAGGFDEKFKMWQDLECWYRILEGRKAKCIKEITYILDISHDLNRISNARERKLIETYDLFCKKHSLTIDEEKMLKTHFFYYGYYYFNINIFIKRVFLSKCLWDCILILKLILKKIK